MNESKNTTIVNLFAIVCIVVVCMFMFNISKQTKWIEQPKNIVWTIDQTWTIKNPQAIIITGEVNRSIGKSTVTKPRDWNSKGNIKTKIQPISNNTIVYVKWFPEDSIATKIATYAYKISNWDIDFLSTLKAENGWFNMYQQSNVYKNGKREESYGLCQMMRKYHPEVNTKIFRESREYQVETCYKKYKWGTKFYGFNSRLKYKDDFIIKYK